MISLENAKRLKELGIEHEIDGGDWFYVIDIPKYDDLENINQPFPIIDAGYFYGSKEWMVKYQAGWECENHITWLDDESDRSIWAPTLSQLLEEVGKRGYTVMSLETEVQPDDCLKLWSFGCDELWWLGEIDNAAFYANADTPEDAVALALISILEGERNG